MDQELKQRLDRIESLISSIAKELAELKRANIQTSIRMSDAFTTEITMVPPGERRIPSYENPPPPPPK